jgi:ATP-dependent RNA helicase SUPV3L1/SUV3
MCCDLWSIAPRYGDKIFIGLEIRTQQARLFNDPSSDHQILVATDAIGMGLNLNIKRIVFETTVKRDDRLSVSDLKQIAGRAGRFNTRFSDGEVTW